MIQRLIIFLAVLSVLHSEASFFIKTEFHQIEGRQLHSLETPTIWECSLKCDQLEECLSFNFADKPNETGLYDCVLLRDKTIPRGLKPSQDYHHYTRIIDTGCVSQGCQNGGFCELLDNNFQCHCPTNGTKGNLCEITTYQWLKVNKERVCFGAKNNIFGRFSFKQNAQVKSIKLVHLSGYLWCTNTKIHKTNNYWGCSWTTSAADLQWLPEYLATIITNSNNKRLLPLKNDLVDPTRMAYKLKGISASSKELVFKLQRAYKVRAGTEYHIWLSEDLLDKDETDNGGRLCLDVLVFGSFD